MIQETLEEAINNYVYKTSNEKNLCDIIIKAIKFGAKWQQQQGYSEEELKSAFKIGFNIGYGSPVQELDLKNEHCEKWFEQFKKK